MLISPKEINKILSVTENDVSIRGKKYFEQSRVKVAKFSYNSDASYKSKTYVTGSMIYEVEIEKKDNYLAFKCDCPVSGKRNTPCKHVIASIFDMYIYPEKYMEFNKKSENLDIDENYAIGKSYKDIQNEINQNGGIISYYENYDNVELMNDTHDVVILPYLKLEKSLNSYSLFVSFKVGKDKFFVIKDLIEFAEAIKNTKKLKYGKNFEFFHSNNAFDEKSKKIVEYICQYENNFLAISSISKNTIELGKEYKSCIPLNGGFLDEFFDMYVGETLSINTEDTIRLVDMNPDLKFSVEENMDEGNLKIVNENGDLVLLFGSKFMYIVYNNMLHRCTNDFFCKVSPFLKAYGKMKSDTLEVSKKDAASFCEYLVPSIKELVKLDVPAEIVTRYSPQELAVKVYLDIDDKSNIIAKIKFCYGDVEFNPFATNLSLECNRNIKREIKVKKIFSDYKFTVNEKKEYLSLKNEDDIYEFLTDGINYFMQKFEVLVTDKLKNKQIISNKALNIGVRIKNNLLEVSFDDFDMDEETLENILKRYSQKKKYYRLKDGTFLNLENSGIDAISNLNENLGVSAFEIASGKFNLPKYRSIYLDTLLKESTNINANVDSSFAKVVNEVKNVEESSYEVPSCLNGILRNYQKTGFNWLKMLDKYNFGGILADDMGLGKTIQIIALLIDAKINKEKSIKSNESKSSSKDQKESFTSIVVCPSSLYINWEKEIKKFAPDINVLVVSGSAKSREELIQSLDKVDVVLTSYDLLKRDIELYKEFTFKYAIADEAQYIKNNNTKNAKALKQINATTRFALTGTPIENSLSELWSIFDFCMPGYLFSYKKFRDDYEVPIIKDDEKGILKKLQKIVAPFILRRMKTDVLKELPDKTETIMYSQMDETQQELYNAYLLKARREMEEEIDENGFEKSKMKVLAMITRLRQICCHPSLFIEDYTGQSSKLEQCMQVIKDAIYAGHKILIFSGFTSMFDIITKRLEKEEIPYFMLTGKTKVETRIQMVDEFNTRDDVKVFLISLKAGGTGLNLTGADMVIHYDPWWNLSAENQATDRAYRIGQRNNVQVFKLISSGTIEEKIINLQERKKDLTNSVISNNTKFINTMSKEEIMELFKV